MIQAARQFSYAVGRLMAKGEGTLEAAMVKAYVCKAAEWVTREAMQIHGGFGYAEEYAVSRYFVDARVLSIFEGADETALHEGHRPPVGGSRHLAGGRSPPSARSASMRPITGTNLKPWPLHGEPITSGPVRSMTKSSVGVVV